MNLLALDTEVAGLDKFHGARPFLVTTCNGKDSPIFFHWHVNPYTRQPEVDKDDLIAIKNLIDEADYIVGQNIKFDYELLLLLFRDHQLIFTPPWSKTYDTLIASHILCSNHPHDLTSIAIEYLGEDISRYERTVKENVLKARRIAKKEFPDWGIASKTNPSTPSVKGSAWAFDMWLPRAIAKSKKYKSNHLWWTIPEDYANCDSVTTIFLWLEMEKRIRSRGLWSVFLNRMRLCEVSMELEMPQWKDQTRGASVNSVRLERMIKDFGEESVRLGNICVGIADSMYYELELPKSGNNKSLNHFCFGTDILICNDCGYVENISQETAKDILSGTEQLPACTSCTPTLLNSEGCIVSAANTLSLSHLDYLNLPVVKRSLKARRPSLDKSALEEYENSGTLKPRSKEKAFISNLASKRKFDTAAAYLKGYRKFLLPSDAENYHYLFQSANPTGTNTLRWSFSNPNTANVSGQGDYNLRKAFGPLPGREWYSMDGQNLELRIAAYSAQEKDAIWVFEHPNDPPYYGSYHLLIFDAIHPEKFKEHGKNCKKVFESSWYTWIKNLNFGLIYGCQESTGDRAAHVKGAYNIVRKRLPKIAALSDKQINFANKHGYVDTIPDIEVDPDHGYPIMCGRSDNGYVLPTVPLNYYIQGCITGNSRVWTDEGLVPIKELVGKRVKVWTGFNWANATGLDRGTCRRAKVYLSSGIIVECDTRHKLKNEHDEWVDFYDMKIGCKVALPKTNDLSEPSEKINWWFILGFILGDGHLSERFIPGHTVRGRNGTVYYQNDHYRKDLSLCGGENKKDILYRIRDFLVEKGYGPSRNRPSNALQVIGKMRGKDWESKGYKPLYTLGLHNPKLVRLLEEMGVSFSWKYDTKRIPESVWRADSQGKRDFIEGLWMSDGARSYSSGSGHCLHMANIPLLREIQIISSSIGLDSRLDEANTILRFLWRANNAKSSRNFPANRLIKIDKIIRSLYKDKNQNITDRRAFSSAQKGVDPSQWVAERIIEINDPKLQIYRYDTITKVEELEDIYERTYTMSVEDELHQFVADGVIHKNTAMSWTNIGMISCHDTLKRWQEEDDFDIYMVFQVHDELDFDSITINKDNLWRIAELKRLMEDSGRRIGVPTPVSVERHIDNWADGVDITQELNSMNYESNKVLPKRTNTGKSLRMGIQKLRA